MTPLAAAQEIRLQWTEAQVMGQVAAMMTHIAAAKINTDDFEEDLRDILDEDQIDQLVFECEDEFPVELGDDLNITTAPDLVSIIWQKLGNLVRQAA